MIDLPKSGGKCRPSRKSEFSAFIANAKIFKFDTQKMGVRFESTVAAGVELLCGDLMAFAFLVRKAIDEDSRNPVTSAGFKKFERKAELLLRLSRQIDRFAQIRRQMSSESEK